MQHLVLHCVRGTQLPQNEPGCASRRRPTTG